MFEFMTKRMPIDPLLRDELNKLAGEGWELTAGENLETGYYRFIFKRREGYVSVAPGSLADMFLNGPPGRGVEPGCYGGGK